MEHETASSREKELGLNQLKEDAKKMNKDLKHEAKETASSMADQIKEKSLEAAEYGRDCAANEISKVAKALHAAGEQLQDEDRDQLSAYVHDMGDRVNEFASTIKSKDFDQLLDEGRNMARRNQVMFVAGGVLIGVAISRFLKSSSHHDLAHHELEARERYSSSYGEEEDYSYWSGQEGTSDQQIRQGNSVRPSGSV